MSLRICADSCSLSALVLKEPYDLDGHRLDGPYLRHAVPDGKQYALATPPRMQYKADGDTVDPETKAEFEEMQKKGVMGSGATDTASQIQNFDLASWMAGKTDTSSRGASPAPQSKKRG